MLLGLLSSSDFVQKPQQEEQIAIMGATSVVQVNLTLRPLF
jgi:hypothetical protein